MKLQNHKFARTLAAAAVATCAVAMLSVGAFAADVAIGEKGPHLRRLRCPGRPLPSRVTSCSSVPTAMWPLAKKDPTYGGYGAPEGPCHPGQHHAHWCRRC